MKVNRVYGLYTSRGESHYRAKPAYPPFFGAITAPCAHPLVRDLFTDTGDRGSNRKRRVGRAKSICDGCPFRTQCADWAAETEQTGVWGGTDETQRAFRRVNGRWSTAEELRRQAERKRANA